MSTDPPPSRARRLLIALSNHRDGILAILLVTLATCWMASYATWRLFDEEVFGNLYDAQAKSLLAGRWDVPKESVRTEGFVRDGKYYTYFGFVPAVLRIPLVLIAPGMDGRWSRVSVISALAISAVYAYLLLLLARRAFGARGSLGKSERNAYPLFIAGVILGSTAIFLACRTFTYHEGPAWAGAMALGCFHHLIRFTLRPAHTSHLVAAGCMAFAAFFSRFTVGAGPVLAIALLGLNVIAWRLRGSRGAGALLAPARALCRWSPGAIPPVRAALIALLFVAITAATYVGVNYAKFRTYLMGHPVWLHEETARDPERMRRIGGTFVSPRNVRMNAWNYLAPNRIEFSRNFPWVYMTHRLKDFPESMLDKVEWYSSLPAATPALFTLAIVGLFCCRRPLAPAGDDDDYESQPDVNRAATPLIALFGACAGAAAMLPAAFVSHRYLHDFFPLLVLSGAFGLNAILRIRRPTFRGVALAAAALALVFSIYVNCAFAMTYQRVNVWGVPRNRRIAFWHVQTFMDKNVSRVIWPDVPLPFPP